MSPARSDEIRGVPGVAKIKMSPEGTIEGI